MGRKKRVKQMEGTYDLKTGGSGRVEVPTGDHGGAGKPGNQNTPDIEFVDRVPSDAEAPIPPKQFGWQNPRTPNSPEPPIVQTGTFPSDASKHDPSFGHRIKK